LQQINKIKQYTHSVCEQIRWKKAHSVISEEIENHIIDQRDTFMKNGLDEIASTNKAIEEMGDPVAVGLQFDRTYRPKIEWSMIFLTIIPLIIGLIVVFLTENDSYTLTMLYKNILSTMIGILVLIAAYFIDFTIIGKFPKTLYILLSVILLTMPFLFPYEINGRYYFLPFAMLLFPTIFSGIIYSMRNKGYAGVLLCGVFYMIPIIAIFFLEGTHSAVISYSAACLILLTIAIYKNWFPVRRLYAMLITYIPVSIAIVLAYLKILNTGYLLHRFQVLFHPYTDPRGSGYLTLQIRTILKDAKIWGRSDMGLDFISGTYNTDYFLTNVLHNFGWIAFIGIIAILSAFIIRGFFLCAKQKSILGRLVSTSVLLTFTIQTVSYIVTNLGFYILPPLSLPLLSYGNTGKIINLGLIGILLSVFKSKDVVRDKCWTVSCERHRLFEFVDGKLIIDLNFK